MDLKNLDFIELITLQNDVSKQLVAKCDNIFSTVQAININQKKFLLVQDEFVKTQELLKRTCPDIKKLENIGFIITNITDYSFDMINFNEKKWNNLFYGCTYDYSKNNLYNYSNTYLKPQDMQKIKEILFII